MVCYSPIAFLHNLLSFNIRQADCSLAITQGILVHVPEFGGSGFQPLLTPNASEQAHRIHSVGPPDLSG